MYQGSIIFRVESDAFNGTKFREDVTKTLFLTAKSWGRYGLNNTYQFEFMFQLTNLKNDAPLFIDDGKLFDFNKDFNKDIEITMGFADQQKQKTRELIKTIVTLPDIKDDIAEEEVEFILSPSKYWIKLKEIEEA